MFLWRIIPHDEVDYAGENVEIKSTWSYNKRKNLDTHIAINKILVNNYFTLSS